jgi:hypothetical protein
LFERQEARRASERVLRILLEGLTQANELWLRTHPLTPPIYGGWLVYRPEPPGEENWDGFPQLLRQGWGDCEDLVAARTAELRVRDRVRAFPDFVWREITRPDGRTQDVYHILVRYPDGRYEDPSRILGMGRAIQ